MTRDLAAQARAILAANDRGGYTVPTDRLYPFQWNWDSAFVAMGFATFDIDRALRELERLAEGQWADGMIPHIVFHAPADSYFPGPAVWGTRHAIPTSGITQPPVFALALAEIARRASPAHRLRIAALYRAALASHRWFAAARDPDGTGLVATLHPWETGRDNSPEWDRPFACVPETTTTAIARRDTGHIDAAMRPRDSDYRRYIHLVDCYRDAGWEPAGMWRAAPFKAADIGTNAILLAAEEALLGLAADHGSRDDESEIATRVARMKRALVGLWSAERGAFFSRDLIAGRPIETLVAAGFLPLLTDAVDDAKRAALLATWRRVMARVRLGAPSTAPGEAGFEPKRYWRGPVWLVVNWLIARGLARQGETAEARALDDMSFAAVADSGFYEYFDPLTGEGLGGPDFSWTAAIALLIADARTAAG
jgi:glycogen debranching enzyme